MKIALLGDIALFGRYSVSGDRDIARRFSGVARHLEAFDHVIGNLETPFVKDGRSFGAKSAYISSDPSNVETLRRIGVTAVNLANNHIFDYGKAGFRSTVDTLDGAGIRYFGVDELQALLDDGSAKVALHGYCAYNTNPLGVRSGTERGVNPLSVPAVVETMRTNARLGYANIVSVHSGWEHVNYPSREDISLARMLAEIGPYVYYGHHPHVVQGIEAVNESLIAYSLGNFCFDDVYTPKSREPLIRQTANNRTGLILEIEISGNRVVGYKSTPIFLGDEAIELDPQGARDDLEAYSAALREPVEAYESRRSRLIKAYLDERRAMRDVSWFLKRMRPSSVELLWRARMNRLAQKRHVADHLVVRSP